MKTGAAPFEEFAREQNIKFKKFRDGEYDKAWEKQREINENIIDAIALSGDEKEKLCEELRRKNNEGILQKKKKIIVTFNNEADKEMAENLREGLEENGNITSILNDEEYKKNIDEVDYVIAIRSNWEDIKQTYEIIYKDEYGIEIVKKHHMIYACYKEIKLGSKREKFIKYYKGIMESQWRDGNEIVKLIEKREKRKKGYKTKVSDCLSEIEIKTEVAPLGINNSVLSTVAGVALFPIKALSSLLIVPTMKVELEVQDVITNLKEKSFDKKFVQQAQKHILQVKIFDYICNEKIRQILESK